MQHHFQAGNGRENNVVEEIPKAGPSGYSEPTATPKDGPDPPGGCLAGTKRLLSTVDPDYDHQPDTKRMREMQQRGRFLSTNSYSSGVY